MGRGKGAGPPCSTLPSRIRAALHVPLHTSQNQHLLECNSRLRAGTAGCTDTTIRDGLYAAGYNLSRPRITALPPRPPLPKPFFTAGRRPPAERACILVTRRASVARCATKSAPDLSPHPSSFHRGAAPVAGPTSTQAALHVPDRTRNYFQRASGAADCCGVFGASPNRPGSEPGHVSSTKAHA